MKTVWKHSFLCVSSEYSTFFVMFRFEAFKPVRTVVSRQVSKKNVLKKKLSIFGAHNVIFPWKQQFFEGFHANLDQKWNTTMCRSSELETNHSKKHFRSYGIYDIGCRIPMSGMRPSTEHLPRWQCGWQHPSQFCCHRSQWKLTKMPGLIPRWWN